MVGSVRFCVCSLGQPTNKTPQKSPRDDFFVLFFFLLFWVWGLGLVGCVWGWFGVWYQGLGFTTTKKK